MYEFIKSLALPLNASGLAPRAITLFNQAMAGGHFRWGRKAKMVAGACISIALRESKRPDSLHDIAFLLDERLRTLTRTFLAVISLLNFSITPAGPSIYITSLETHLSSMLEAGQDSGLPASLVTLLKPLSLRSVANTSRSLCDLIARLGPRSSLTRLPAAPTACAVFMLSLEAEARATVDNLGDLAQCLASRCHIGKTVVALRYKMVQDEVMAWIENLPWLEKYSNRSGRAKVSKRLVVARGLKDVVRFQDEIWQQTARPKVILETSGDDPDSSGSETESTSSTSSQFKRQSSVGEDSQPQKRRKIQHALRDASQFLMNPLSGPMPSSLASTYPQHRPPLPLDALVSGGQADPSYRGTYLPLTSYLLTVPSSSLSGRAPTRLQLLSVARGGEGEIGDDELFDEGELEGMMRNEDEARALRHVFGWHLEEGEPVNIPSQGNTGEGKGKRCQGNQFGRSEERPGSKRVDLNALARFMQAADDKYDPDLSVLEHFDDDKDDREDDEDDHQPSSPVQAHHHRLVIGHDDDAEVVLENWRPLSPQCGASYNVQAHYDEEYD